MAAPTSSSPVRASPHILSLLSRLHKQSLDQEDETNATLQSIIQLRQRDGLAGASYQLDKLMLDKFVALDQDKCEFVYQLILATGARTVVEAGTSFGVSTIYLALAVAQNSPESKVIAMEKEESKVRRARAHWEEGWAGG